MCFVPGVLVVCFEWGHGCVSDFLDEWNVLVSSKPHVAGLACVCIFHPHPKYECLRFEATGDFLFGLSGMWS